MIPKDCKRLAEVDFPIATVSKHSATEKSVRYGHPSTLHLWWARRPLGACRSILLSLLFPDPCDPLCPLEFKQHARQLLPTVQGSVKAGDEQLRFALLKLIGDFANWDLSSSSKYIDIANSLIKSAHKDDPPLVVDPFAGGGSIPLEAIRLGCEALGSDLNPVSCLILKIMLEEAPRYGPQLIPDLRRVGAQIQRESKKALSDFFPIDQDGAIPMAYLWARTIRCEAPACGAEIPLMKSLVLSKKSNARKALRFKVTRSKNAVPRIDPELYEPVNDKDVGKGTVTRAKATCVACGSVLLPARVRAQLAQQRGGADVVFDDAGNRTAGARIMTVILIRPGEQGRTYRLPSEKDYLGVYKAKQGLAKIVKDWESNMEQEFPFPNEALPLMSGTFNVPLYGMSEWGDLFTVRQKFVLVTLIDIIKRLSLEGIVRDVIGLALSRLTDIYNNACSWEAGKTQVRHLFTGQAIPMRWDFPESNAIAEQAGDFSTTLETMIRALDRLTHSKGKGITQLSNATNSPLPDQSAHVWFTDPPYYFAVPYADLSDFFFVWLKRVLPGHPLLRDPFDRANKLTPKEGELCEMAHWDSVRYANKDQKFFENGMAQAFTEGRRVLREDGIASVVFAHKTTEGWEALLSGIIRGGWTITGSWPIATELANRPRARESAALATSVHLICRPREDDARVGDWADVLRELPARVADWMDRLQAEGVRGADLVFACIGPALEIFSRYTGVETAEGRNVDLAEFLEKVWEVVGRAALEHVLGTNEARARNGAAGAVEEDARLTALFLWTLQSTASESLAGNSESADDDGADDDSEDDDEDSTRAKQKGYTLVFDVVRRFAQPLGINLPKWEGRVIETKKGVVRLLPVGERARLLFGSNGEHAIVQQLEEAPSSKVLQLSLFPDLQVQAEKKNGGGKRLKSATITGADEPVELDHKATTLDRLHVAILLQSSGRANALRTLLRAEMERGNDFLRLANALSALYPKGSEEKRLLDAMLLAVPR